MSRLTDIETETGRRFAFETKDALPPDHVRILAEGPAAEIEAKGLPVSPGQELLVKLEERHLLDEGDAIARLDGYVIAVAGAGSKVGRRMKIRIERATRTSAYAVLTSAKTVEKPVEATDLDELEPAATPKPRRRSAKKPVEPPAEGQAAEEPAAEEPAAEEAEAEAPGAEVEARPKKRTRRGSRGGRGRKKKVVGAETPEAVGVEPPAEIVEAEPAGEGVQEVKPKKKTRRGSRGGRRRKRPVTAEGEQPAEAGPALGEPVTSFAGEEERG